MHTITRIAHWIVLGLAVANAPAATFTYHGSLQDGGKPAEGKYDLELTLYPAARGGSAIGGPLTMNAVPVQGGNFSTEADFGPLTHIQGDAWLGVKVRPAGNNEEFVPLLVRAPVTAASTSSVCPGAWTLQGNAGNPVGSYLGTADTQPLTFDVNAVQVAQITASGNATYPDAANIIFGSHGNSVGTGVGGAAISGGGSTAQSICGPSNNQSCVNKATATFGTVGGGLGNTASGSESTVSGGEGNTASTSGDVVGGGLANTASGGGAVVGGGGLNFATGGDSTISGGFQNVASGRFATVAGGLLNTADGAYSFAVGESSQANGDFSFAAGYRAGVRGSALTPGCTSGTNCGDYGTYVWADSQTSPFTSSGPNQFLIRALGGVGINTNVPNGVSLRVGSDTTNGNGAFVSNGGTWTNGSSRTFKEGFTHIDPGAILDKLIALPISAWQYKNDAAEGTHLGPVAEDFKAAFGLGSNERYIATVDEEGIALAAIQGLNARLQTQITEKDSEIDDLRGELDLFRARLAKLEADKGE